MSEVLLGLDVGTSSVKALALDLDGREVAEGRAQTPWHGTEIDPDDLLRAALAAAAEAATGRVVAIGVASIAETGVLLDRAGRPVVPGIAWHDPRGEAEAERLARDLGDFPARVGLPPTCLCTLAKYRWLRDHVTDAARGVRWLNVAEWIVHGLGGDPAAELSLASRTGFYDLHARRPWDEALAWADAPAGLLPEAVPAGTPMGTATEAMRGAVLTVGGHDHLAAAVGAGAAGEGDVLDSCGTAEAFVRATAPLPPDRVAAAVADEITVGWHAVEGRQALLGALWSGAALERVLESLGVAPTERAALEAAAYEIERARAAGDESPAGADESPGGGSSPGATYHAALDRVGAEAAAVLGRMAKAAGPARRLVVTGGWAAGEGARAVKARHLGAFEHSPALSTGARGAAIAAGGAAGITVPAARPGS
jgi:sugar (pentulose or hexulose) kinase